ncbi:hypothetical protein TYRP_008832 [Tyrophagus putrescentiae]|nr:hypothetical protein TYRP_008832 [Tyrophagus putrescentiae]
MLARRSVSTVSRVLFSSSKAGASIGGGGDKPKKAPKAENKEPSKTAQPKAAPAPPQQPPKFSNDSYQAPEYFAHDKWSYADVILELASKRLPQKSNKVPST